MPKRTVPPPAPAGDSRVAGVADALDFLESRRRKGFGKKRRSDLDLDSIR